MQLSAYFFTAGQVGSGAGRKVRLNVFVLPFECGSAFLDLIVEKSIKVRSLSRF